MGGQEGRGVLGRAVKKVNERRTEGNLSRENKKGESGSESKSIIRLANDLHACTGYKGNHRKCTRDRLANETTVNELKQGRRGWR